MPKNPKVIKKIEKAVELWKEMPGVTRQVFQEAFEKKYGQTISQPAMYYAKRTATQELQVGKVATTNGEPSLAQVRKTQELAKQHGGVKKLHTDLTQLKTIAEQVGGFDQLEHSLAFLNDVAKS